MRYSVCALLLVLCFVVVNATEPHWKVIIADNDGPQNLGLGAHSLNIHDGKMYVFGGYHEDFEDEVNTFYNQFWAFNLHTHHWTSLPTAPAPRAFHMNAIDTHNEHLYIYGGETYTADFSAEEIFSDLWKFDLNTHVWTEITQRPITPGGRSNCQMVYHAGHLYLFGGIEDVEFTTSKQLWKYHIASNTWTELRSDSSPDGPGARFTYFATKYRSSNGHTNFLAINGEHINGSFFDFTYRDDWSYDINADTWNDITPALPINNFRHGNGGSSGAQMGILSSYQYPIFAGEAPGGVAECGAPFTTNVQNTTWTLDLSKLLWSQRFPTAATAADLPLGVKRSAADTKGNSMYLFGGWNFICVNNVGGQVWPPHVYRLNFNSADDDDE